ncbi:restriction endonuclease [Enterococcus casseliflavus]|jgi:hypothetical protein|uniref:restriction endonuclease n=1 Tax=Enterococcus casseliflavus TaxID=37734 RepID=UPI00115CB85E|nr:restriction endonuclease [Enterococcus casseliflavus]
MITEFEVKKFLSLQNYDIRVDKNGRWIDQKCTPDVVNIIADCVMQYIFDPNNPEDFSSVDIWHYKYTEDNIRDIFNKPSTEHGLSRNEYDKFFAQPLEMLANAKVLSKSKKSNRNIYSVNDLDILEYISLHERNALKFIANYCERVLIDSGIWNWFEFFFNKQTQDAYMSLKENFEHFIITNTPINGNTEVRRIFTKIINPMAYTFRKCGTCRGRISRYPITYAELMYNRENFRDSNQSKPKGMTRQEWNDQRKVKINIKYFKYQSIKAKRYLRKFNDQFRNGVSEVNDDYSAGAAIHMHHIFPEHQYPEISMFLENIIALTPSQHITKAHPMGNTQRIDVLYQELLLKTKAHSIEENLLDENVDTIYTFENFIEVLNVGFRTNYEVEENDFVNVMTIISNYYA